MPPSPLARLRKICLALPEAHEVEAWGEPTFRVKNKMFATFAAANNHHGGGRPAVWCKAGPGNQALMIDAEPDRYFAPPYVGPSGWIGVWLDREPDWNTVADLMRDAWLLIAPKKLAAQFAEPSTPKPPRSKPKRPTTKRSTKPKPPSRSKPKASPKRTSPPARRPAP